MENIPQQEPKQERQERVSQSERVLRPTRPFMSRLPGMVAFAVATTVGAGGVATEAEAGNSKNVLGAIAGVMAVSAALNQNTSRGDRLEIKRGEDFKVQVDARAENTMRNLRLNYDASSQRIISPNGERLTLDEAGRKNLSVSVTGLTNSQLKLDYVYIDQFGAFKQTSYVTLGAFNNFQVWKEMPQRISK